jgi:hypothetical protein
VAKSAIATSAFILNLTNKRVLQTWNVPQQPFVMPHDITVDWQNSVYISEIDLNARNKVTRFDVKSVTSVEQTTGPPSWSKSNQTNQTNQTNEAENNRKSKTSQRLPFHVKLLIFSSSFLLVTMVAWIYVHFKFSRRQKHDFSVAFKQLFSTPKDDGFDRLALDDELNERLMTDDSGSEVEEFSSTRYTRK